MKTIGIILSCLVLYIGLNMDNKNSWLPFSDKPAIQAQSASLPIFGRGKTDLQNQPCANAQGGHYESEIISKVETVFYLQRTPFNAEQVEIMAAISRAESGSQINCYGDDTNKYYGKSTSDGQHWGVSYGLYQIRTIQEQSGKGTCRDIERLRLNIAEQTICAWEISGHGNNFSAWSTTHSSRGKPYLKYMNQDW